MRLMQACCDGKISRPAPFRNCPLRARFGSNQSLHSPDKSKRPLVGAFCFIGGEGGVRTLVTGYRKHDFESCAFNRSATSPGWDQDRSGWGSGFGVLINCKNTDAHT